MQTLNFSTLQLSIDPPTHSITATMKQSELSAELLFELESLLNFLSQHIEVSTFILKGFDDHFGKGFDPGEIQRGDEHRQKKYVLHLQKIVVGLLHLPQTVIADLGRGAEGASFELSLGADIKIASKNATFSLNQLGQGHVPSSGGMNLLAALTNPSLAKALVMSGNNINAPELFQKGYIYELTEDCNSQTLSRLLWAISNQAPIARIQAKKAFLEGIKESLDLSFSVDFGIFLGTQVFHDWKNYLEAQKNKTDVEFTSAKQLKNFLNNNKEGPSPSA